MHFDPSKKLDDIQAKKIVREIVRLGNIIYGYHAKKRMIERGYTIPGCSLYPQERVNYQKGVQPRPPKLEVYISVRKPGRNSWSNNNGNFGSSHNFIGDGLRRDRKK